MKTSSTEVLGVIVARGGSKSIHKKSIAVCAGKPLMLYTIEAAKHAKNITRLIISTDSEEMADMARSYGVEVPFMRPSELAEDITPDLPVFQHVLRTLKEESGYVPDAVIQLRPTTPLKKSADIDRGVELLCSHPEAHSVRSVCEPTHTPFKMYQIDKISGLLEPLLQKEFPEVFEKFQEPYNMPRQLLPEVWRHSGYVDVIRPKVITELNSMSGTQILPLMFEKWRDIDIDSQFELEIAEKILQRLETEKKNFWE